MKKLLPLFALLLLAAGCRPARAQSESKMLFFTETSRQRDLIDGRGAHFSDPTAFRALVVFRSKEVRLNLDQSGPEQDLVYPVVAIRELSHRHQIWVWQCEDRTFTLDIRRNRVTVLYRASTFETVYSGTLQAR